MSASKALVFAHKVQRELRARGVWGMTKSIPAYAASWWRRWQDGAIDRKYGTDTGGILEKEALAAHGEHSGASTGYEAIQVPLFRRIMRDVPARPSEHVFVDFGSGKGRALLMAAEYGFKRVIGIELSPLLHQVAAANAARVKGRTELSPIELHCGDAAQYDVPEEDVVCFFYNPFGRVVMRKVVANLEASYLRRPRRLLVAYRNPVCADLFDSSRVLRLSFANRHYRIYEAALDGGAKPTCAG